jgi:uncharacterized membrane protein HdeD (DUF308 family)
MPNQQPTLGQPLGGVGGPLGVLLGIQLLVEGAALTYLAWRIRES